MRERADRATGSTGDSVRPRVQPAAGADADEDGPLPADERLDRMLGDQDLLFRLQLSKYAAEEWGPAAAEFARYGLDVIKGWLYTGAIFTKVYEKTKRRLRRPDDRFDEDSVETLATDTVVAALDAFLERVLKRNRWDPNKGASLKTFFIGQCCFQFSNAYRSWYRSEQRLRRIHLVDDDVLRWLQTSTARGADAGLVQRSDAIAALELLSTDSAREAVRLASIGYSYAEIAKELELADEKAVENLIGYQRRRLTKMTKEQAS